MAERIVLQLSVEPCGKGRPRFGNGRTYTDAKTKAYEQALGWTAKQTMGGRRPLTGALHVAVFAHMGIPKSWTKADKQAATAGAIHHIGTPDADNILKSLDALNGICWRDDAQIVHAEVVKRYAAEPSLTIHIEELAGGADE